MERQKDSIIRHVMIPLSSKITERRVASFDVETYDDAEHVPRFVCGSVYSEHTKKSFTDVDEMRKELLGYKFRNHWIFATMLDFDFFVVFRDDWYRLGMKPIFRGSSLISVMHEGREPRRFLDTMNYYPVGLNKLGECIGMQKLKQPRCWKRRPKDSMEMAELLDYNMNDSRMTYEWVRWFQSNLNAIGCNMKNTIASTSLWNYRRHYQETPIYQPSVAIMTEQLEGYYGGRTELFYRGTHDKGMNLYDCNGMHAWAMTQEFPDTSSLVIDENPSLDKIEQYHGITLCDVETTDDLFYPLLPYRREKKLIFPIGRFRSWQSNIELREAMRMGYDITPIKSYLYTASHRPFRRIQELYYKMRRESKDMQLVYKLLSNALYGKWAQRWDDETVYTHISQLPEIPEGFDDIINDFVLSKKSRTPPMFINPIFSIYTTAYARLRLHENLVRYDGVYCDTDSVMTERSMPESTELGGFKLERRMDRLVLVRPKVYFVEETGGRKYVKSKGLKIRTQEEFQFMLEKGFFPVERMLRFKESVRRKKPVLFGVKFPKRFHLQDDKRLWNDMFHVDRWEMSAPITLQVGAECTAVQKSHELRGTEVKKEEGK